MSSLVFLLVGLFSNSAHAVATEVGFNYQYKKTIVDSLNNVEQQGMTGTLALYFWEQVATEFSYTNSVYVKREKADAVPGSSLQRITTQTADVYGLDLIYVRADRKARFQPYIKGGIAYLKKKQSYIQGTDSWPTDGSGVMQGWGPSYGVGLKFFLTETISFRAGYDVVRTPIDNSNSADDTSARVGLSWML